MLLPPLTLPLLNATSLLHLNTITAPETSRSNQDVWCFQQRPPPRLQRAITTYHDCMLLARRIVQGGKPESQIDFSRDEEVGLKVPYRLYGGTCVFEINIDPQEAREKSWAASYYEISLAAIEIFPPCVVRPPHLGGLTKVGRDQVLDLYVYGNTVFKQEAIGTA